MDELVTLLLSAPFPTLLVITVIVLAGSRLRGSSSASGARQMVVALACYAGAWLVLSWAGESAGRLTLLLVALVGVALFAFVQILRGRIGRRPTGHGLDGRE